MGGGDQVLDLRLVVLEVRVDVGGVDDAGALGLREDEVEEEEETDVGVQRDPGEKKVSKRFCYGRREGCGRHSPDEEPFGPTLNEESAGEDDPVHQPWCQLGGVGGLEGFVGGEEREEEGGDGAENSWSC